MPFLPTRVLLTGLAFTALSLLPAQAQRTSEAGPTTSGTAQTSEVAWTSGVGPTSVAEELVLTQAARPLSLGEALGEVRARLQGEGLAGFDAYLAGPQAAGGHFALVAQEGTGNAGAITQTGTANVAVLVQQGDLNRSALTQEGEANLIGLFLHGDGNRFDVAQRGDANVYLLDFAGDRLDHEILQVGDGNQAVQLGTGVMPFGIEQRGDGLNLIIRHNGF